MISKKEIEAARLRTKMADAASNLKQPYPSVKENAKKHLNMLQESYKMLMGEYCDAYMIKEEDYLGGLKEQLGNVCGNFSPHVDPKDIATMLRAVADEYDAKA